VVRHPWEAFQHRPALRLRPKTGIVAFPSFFQVTISRLKMKKNNFLCLNAFQVQMRLLTVG